MSYQVDKPDDFLKYLESRRMDMPRIPVINTSHLDRIDELLVDNIETGEFKLHRSVLQIKPYLTLK